jgi:hypothetical protein
MPLPPRRLRGALPRYSAVHLAAGRVAHAAADAELTAVSRVRSEARLPLPERVPDRPNRGYSGAKQAARSLAETSSTAGREGTCNVRGITIDAKSLDSAHRLYSALTDFHPELSGSEEEGYRVSVELGSGERRLLEILNALERYVTESASDPTPVVVAGHRYMIHAAHA